MTTTARAPISAIHSFMLLLVLAFAGCATAPIPAPEVTLVHVPVEVLPALPPELMTSAPPLPSFTSPDTPEAVLALDKENSQRFLELQRWAKGQIDGLRALLNPPAGDHLSP